MLSNSNTMVSRIIHTQGINNGHAALFSKIVNPSPNHARYDELTALVQIPQVKHGSATEGPNINGTRVAKLNICSFCK